MSNTRQHISPALAGDVSQLLSATPLDELPVKPQKVNNLMELLLARIKTLPSWEKCNVKDGTLLKLIKLLLVLAAPHTAISSVTLVQLGVPASEINLFFTGESKAVNPYRHARALASKTATRMVLATCCFFNCITLFLRSFPQLLSSPATTFSTRTVRKGATYAFANSSAAVKPGPLYIGSVCVSRK
jgi:hypothetical protein